MSHARAQAAGWRWGELWELSLGRQGGKKPLQERHEPLNTFAKRIRVWKSNQHSPFSWKKKKKRGEGECPAEHGNGSGFSLPRESCKLCKLIYMLKTIPSESSLTSPPPPKKREEQVNDQHNRPSKGFFFLLGCLIAFLIVCRGFVSRKCNMKVHFSPARPTH